jgi:hypothetical protein
MPAQLLLKKTMKKRFLPFHAFLDLPQLTKENDEKEKKRSAPKLKKWLN